MLSGFIIAVALVLGGLAVMRFGIFQIRKFKKGETRAVSYTHLTLPTTPYV